jgi:hypothetical protein
MKRLAELRSEDFEVHPVWGYYGTEGTEDTDAVVEPRAVVEVTEADPTVLLAATEFHLADGTAAAGFCSPADDSGLDYVQPVIFIADRQVPLWRPGLGGDVAARICLDLGRPASDVFPIAWRCLVPVDGEVRAGNITSSDVLAG